MATITHGYDIGTGSKSQFYTLWETTTIDLRPTPDTPHKMRGGHVMDVFVRYKYRQNLSKDRTKAIQRAKELGADLPEDAFSFEIKEHNQPQVKAFGAVLKHKKSSKTQKHYYTAIATPEFLEEMKENGDELKKYGWSTFYNNYGDYADFKTYMHQWETAYDEEEPQAKPKPVKKAVPVVLYNLVTVIRENGANQTIKVEADKTMHFLGMQFLSAATRFNVSNITNTSVVPFNKETPFVGVWDGTRIIFNED